MLLNKFSVGVPSNRKIDEVGASLDAIITHCKKNKYQLVISDNSGEEKKEKILRQMMQGDDSLVYLKTPSCGMLENWFHAFTATKGDFVLMIGDDDKLFNVGPKPDYDFLPKDIIGIKPNVIAYTDAAGLIRVNSNGVQSETAADRVREYYQNANGANLGMCSFWRRDILQSIMELWFLHHPTKGQYCDWAVIAALVSSGRIIQDLASYYFYDLSNWHGDAHFVKSQIENAFLKSGLPAGASAYAALFNALDSFIFINRHTSPVDAAQKWEAAMLCFNSHLNSYVDGLDQGGVEHANAKHIRELSRTLASQEDLVSIFKVIFDILEAIQPDLGVRYERFYEYAIGKKWGTI